MGPPPPELIIILASIAAITTLGFGVIRVLTRYVDRKFQGGGAAELAQLADRVAGLEREVAALRDGEVRIADLEERLDFTERVLTRQAERELPGGGR